MENYVIPNIYNLELMLESKGNRIYCLAHFYLAYPHYREWFLDKKKEGYFITLDNSAAEKSLVTEEKLLKITEELKPDEVIPPDVLFDKDSTLNNFYSFIDHNKDVSIFACPQGKDMQTWLECYDEMVKHPRVTVVGLSKITIPVCFNFCEIGDEDKNIKEGRHACVDFLVETGRLTKPLHFLGMGDPTEYSYYMKNRKFEKLKQYFRTTDSCYTVLAAVNGVDFQKCIDNGVDIPRIVTDNQFYTKKIDSDEVYNMCIRNIKFLKGEIDG